MQGSKTADIVCTYMPLQSSKGRARALRTMGINQPIGG
jgi:hypothetical protein